MHGLLCGLSVAKMDLKLGSSNIHCSSRNSWSDRADLGGFCRHGDHGGPNSEKLRTSPGSSSRKWIES